MATTKINPRISVLLPVYNAEQFVGETIECVLAQTYTDYELVVINDGSTDKSEEVILSYNDPRIRYVRNEQNMGLIATLNKGLALCTGEYIARMDADDISLPERFAKQVAYLDQHPEVGMVGTWIYVTDADGNPKREVRYATSAKEVRVMMALYCQFAHSSVMMRNKLFKEHALRYNPNYKHAEDYKLWVDMLDYCELENLPACMSTYRFHESNTSTNNKAEQLDGTELIRNEYISKLLDRKLRLNTTMLLCTRVKKVEDWDEYLWMLTALRKQLHSQELYDVIGDSLSYALKCDKYPFVRIWQGRKLFKSHKQALLALWHWVRK